MEEVTQAAKAAYENFSEEEKRHIQELFKSLDKNGDGNISFHEFMAFSGEKGGAQLVKRSVFDLLDQNGDGSLQFDEVVTLCYLIASGRPTCADCGDLIGGLFFSCTHCRFDESGNSYDLCVGCYRGGKLVHEHKEFLDNYMLLSKMQQMMSHGELVRNQSTGSGSFGAEPPHPHATSCSEPPKLDGTHSKREKWKNGFQQFARVMVSFFTDVLVDELEKVAESASTP